MPDLIPVDATFANSAPQRIEVEHRIAATTAEVWNVIADNSTWTSWFDGMSSCEPTSDPDSGVGASRQVKVGPMQLDEQFITWEEESCWAFTVTKTSIPFAKRMLEQIELTSLESTGGSAEQPATRVRYLGAIEPHPLTRLVFPLLARQLKATWRKSFANLDNLITA